MTEQTQDGGEKFERNGSQHDLTAYGGRYRHFMDFINPKYLLRSADQMREAKALLDAYDERRIDHSVADAQLWDAQSTVQSSFAADGTVIPMPFRMCGFIPFNSFMVAGMLLPLPPSAQAVFQWANQTHNAAINHFNRPSAEPASIQDMAKPYCLAIGSALGILFGATAALKRSNFSPAAKRLLGKLIPFAAIATAGVANVGFMRAPELSAGIPIQDEHGNTVGVSQEAAKKAIMLTAISRIALSASLTAVPPFIFPLLQRGIFARSRVADVLMQTAVVSAIFYAALPNMLALFPQKVQVAPADLEPRFYEYEQANKRLYFDKGL
jgi:sideroflexin-5